MKKSVYMIACIVCGLLIVAMALAWIIPVVLPNQAEKQILGTWKLDSFEGKGCQYATFDEENVVHLYTEVTMADNSVISQDYSSLGLMTYKILDRNTIQFSTTVMGTTTTETVSYRFEDNNTLIMDGNTYSRYVGVLSDKN